MLICSCIFYFSPLWVFFLSRGVRKRESPYLSSSSSSPSSTLPPSSHPINHDLPVPRGRCCDKWDFPGFAPFNVISLYQAQGNGSEARRRPGRSCFFTRFHFVLRQAKNNNNSPIFFSFLFSHFFLVSIVWCTIPQMVSWNCSTDSKMTSYSLIPLLVMHCKFYLLIF